MHPISIIMSCSPIEFPWEHDDDRETEVSLYHLHSSFPVVGNPREFDGNTREQEEFDESPLD